MIEIIIGYDATSENEHVLPNDVLVAGYDTQVGNGPPYIKWTDAQWAAHRQPYPALHIDQDPAAGDYTFDYMDVETGAFTDADIVNAIDEARYSYHQIKRPGQRWPGVYCSANNVPSAVSVLQRASLTDVPFIVADYSISQAEATRRVATAIGPYPAVGYQFSDQAFNGLGDANVFSLPWVTTVAHFPIVFEDDNVNGMFNKQVFAPFPAGKYKGLYLYRDFVPSGESATIRVAAHSASKGYSQIWNVTLNESKPVHQLFTESDVDGVSLVLETSALAPIGYTLA